MVNVTITAVNGTAPISYSAVNVPSGLTFTDNGNNTATLSGTADDGTAANSPYAVTVTATDDNGLTDDVIVNVIINPALNSPAYDGVASGASPAPAATGLDPGGTGSPIQGASFGKNLVGFLTYNTGGGAANSYRVYDTSDPNAPVFKYNHFVLNGTSAKYGRVCHDPVTQRAWVGRFTSGLDRLDVSDPDNIVVAASLADSNYHGLEFNGTYLATFENSETPSEIVFRDADSLAVVGSVSLPYPAYGMAFVGDYLIVNMWHSGPNIHRIHQYRVDGTPTASLWATYLLDNDAGSTVEQAGIAMLSSQEHFAMVSGRGDWLEIFDINEAESSTDNAPVATLMIDASLISHDPEQYFNSRLHADTSGLVYYCSDSEVSIVDCSNPLSPSLLTQFGGGGNSVVVNDSKLFVVDSVSDVNVYT